MGHPAVLAVKEVFEMHYVSCLIDLLDKGGGPPAKPEAPFFHWSTSRPFEAAFKHSSSNSSFQVKKRWGEETKRRDKREFTAHI
ncbi:hypothetical protein TMEN_8692 [Trichophyton mentagrophytes]|nr:hypothetical protein TMEN_8692 [Trichophyton mentagrophytes]